MHTVSVWLALIARMVRNVALHIKINMDVTVHQHAQTVEQKRKDFVRESHVNANVLNHASCRARSFASLKKIAMDVLPNKCAVLERKTSTTNIVMRIQRLMVVLFYAMRYLVSVRVFQQKTYLDAEVKHGAQNAKEVKTVAFVLSKQLAQLLALKLKALRRNVDWMMMVVQFGSVGRVTQI